MHDIYAHFDALRGIKSDPSPCAQTATLLQQGTAPDQVNFDMDLFAASHLELQTFELAVIELMFLWGLRVTEVLQITCADVSRSGNIRIKALKGSNFRVVRSSVYSSFWLNSDSSILPISSVFSRYYFYRLFKRLGLYSHFGNNVNNSVTHYFRHLRGLDVQNSFADWELTASALGHKSTKSTVYYAQDKTQ